jgi:hypothetical protein
MQRRVAILPVRTSPLPSERPEAQEGQRDVRGRGSKDPAPAAPVVGRAKVTSRNSRPSCLLPLSVRKLPHGQRIERARSRSSEEDAHGVNLSDGQRDAFRRQHVCLLDDGQWGAAETTLPRSQPDHNPLSPAVIGHLAPVKNMDAHREWIQAPVLASQTAVAGCHKMHARNG